MKQYVVTIYSNSDILSGKIFNQFQQHKDTKEYLQLKNFLVESLPMKFYNFICI